jgi:uncharacterized protein (TIGR02145 family)
MKFLLFIFLTSILTSLKTQQYGSFTDSRDGKTYSTFQVAGYDLFWMAENLSTSKFRNGDNISQARNAAEWRRAGEKKQPAWCYYNFDPTNDGKYGKLYNWFAVNDSRGIAPNGWHIPSINEWENFTSYF